MKKLCVLLLIILNILNILDSISTYYALNVGGHELNIIMKYIIVNAGMEWFFVIKIGLLLLFSIYFYKHSNNKLNITLFFLILIYATTVILNFKAISCLKNNNNCKIGVLYGNK